MFVNLDGVLINKEYIGYAYIFKRDEGGRREWVLHVRFMNENQHADYLELKYETRKEAEELLKKIGEELK